MKHGVRFKVSEMGWLYRLDAPRRRGQQWAIRRWYDGEPRPGWSGTRQQMLERWRLLPGRRMAADIVDDRFQPEPEPEYWWQRD